MKTIRTILLTVMIIFTLLFLIAIFVETEQLLPTIGYLTSLLMTYLIYKVEIK